jgi:hypothetical protein
MIAAQLDCVVASVFESAINEYRNPALARGQANVDQGYVSVFCHFRLNRIDLPESPHAASAIHQILSNCSFSSNNHADDLRSGRVAWNATLFKTNFKNSSGQPCGEKEHD